MFTTSHTTSAAVQLSRLKFPHFLRCTLEHCSFLSSSHPYLKPLFLLDHIMIKLQPYSPCANHAVHNAELYQPCKIQCSLFGICCPDRYFDLITRTLAFRL